MPLETDCYNLLKMLKSIVEIVVSPIIHVQTPMLLNTLITEYLSLHNELFPGKLRPKHHFLQHYCEVMINIGPLCKVNCMRLDETHHVGKVTSHVAISIVNVCRTIALKAVPE